MTAKRLILTAMSTLLARSGCWLLLVMMAMAPVARAAEAAVHLCCGELRIDLVKPCCCPPQASPDPAKQHATHDTFHSLSGQAGCCELKAVARTPDAPAPVAARVLLEVAPLAVLPPAIDLPLAVHPVSPDSGDLRRLETPEQVSAVPLYLRLRHWLI